MANHFSDCQKTSFDACKHSGNSSFPECNPQTEFIFINKNPIFQDFGEGKFCMQALFINQTHKSLNGAFVTCQAMASHFSDCQKTSFDEYKHSGNSSFPECNPQTEFIFAHKNPVFQDFGEGKACMQALFINQTYKSLNGAFVTY